MVKSVTRFSIIISVISLAIAIAALIVAVCRIEPVTIEWLGLLVGVLGLLTSVLLGWQVFSIINLRGMEAKLKAIEDESRKGDSAAIGKAYDGIATLYITSFPDETKSADEIASAHIYGYLLFSALAMAMQSEAGNFDYCESTIGHLLKLESNLIKINTRQRDNLFDIASKITTHGNIKNYSDYMRWLANLA